MIESKERRGSKLDYWRGYDYERRVIIKMGKINKIK
jgi:hypothetical protein